MTESSGANLEVVPGDEQNQEAGQHVNIPVPHRDEKNLQEEPNVSRGTEKGEESRRDTQKLTVDLTRSGPPDEERSGITSTPMFTWCSVGPTQTPAYELTVAT